jgi:DNA-binding MarR family transcriptional regulator
VVVLSASAKKLFKYFLREKPSMMLIKLRNQSKARYPSIIAKEVDCTYAHTVRVLQEMEKYKLITFKKDGRRKLITLTKRGKEISEVLVKLMNLFENAQ